MIFSFKKECKNNSCFSRNLDSSSSNNSVNLNDFKKVNNFLLGKKTNFFEIFQSKEYMSVKKKIKFKCRNALIVLHAISAVYPISKENGKDLLKAILEAKEKLSDYDDLTMMVKRYTDNLSQKLEILPSETEVGINDNKDKKNGGILLLNYRSHKKEAFKRKKRKR